MQQHSVGSYAPTSHPPRVMTLISDPAIGSFAQVPDQVQLVRGFSLLDDCSDRRISSGTGILLADFNRDGPLTSTDVPASFAPERNRSHSCAPFAIRAGDSTIDSNISDVIGFR